MRRTGDHFEQRACRQLQAAGLTVLARNFHTRFGELDLVMLDNATLAFVEVRYRQQQDFGSAAESITAHKRQCLIRAAEGFRAANACHANRDCRFDLVTFDGNGDQAEGHWHQGVFDAF